MLPVSAPAIGDLSTLAKAIDFITKDNGKELLDAIQDEMNLVMAKGLEVSDREFKVAARERSIVESEKKAEESKAIAEAAKEKYLDLLDQNNAAKQSLSDKMVEFEAIQKAFSEAASSKEADMEYREQIIQEQESKLGALIKDAQAKKDDYEAKVESLKLALKG